MRIPLDTDANPKIRMCIGKRAKHKSMYPSWMVGTWTLLGKVKTNIDSGIFQAVQWAGVAALEGDQGCVEEMRKIYRNRRRVLVEGLKKIGWDVASAEATFYVWVAVPQGYDSKKLAMRVLEECGIVITPGVGFGEGGEGYVRFALTRDEKRIGEAIDRLAKLKL